MGANLSENSGSRVGETSSSSSGSSYPRKRRWWRRRNSTVDPGKPLRDLMTSWPLTDVMQLASTYSTLTYEKDLYMTAESSRPTPPTLQTDLADLLDFKYNSDVNLLLPPASFPAHRCILMSRSKYFRQLLQNGSPNIQVDLNIDIPRLSRMLRYLYTGENEDPRHSYGEVRLDHDLGCLLNTGKYSDLNLIWSDDSGEISVAVHKAVLSARSAIFRNMLSRHTSHMLQLDTAVIPRRYARALLHYIYTDRLDFSLIGGKTGLNQVESLTSNGSIEIGIEEGFELYQIARFLELDSLSHKCEDLLVDSISLDNIIALINWSKEPHGSKYVFRNCLVYLREDYLNFFGSPGFFELERSIFCELISSDFVQSSESDILQSVVRWGEEQLKRADAREPNLLSSSTPRDLKSRHLAELLQPLMKQIRTEYVINNDLLLCCVRRGMLSLPPSHMLSEENPWGRTVATSRPRLYTVFYEETKALLGAEGAVCLNRIKGLVGLPDTLYMMVGSQGRRHEVADVADLAIDPDLFSAMVHREKKLKSQHSRLLNQHVLTYIRLRVVREFGMPDSVAQLLDRQPQPPPALNNPARQAQAAASVTQRESPTSLSERMPDVAIGAEDRGPFEEAGLQLGIVGLDLGDGERNRGGRNFSPTMRGVAYGPPSFL